MRGLLFAFVVLLFAGCRPTSQVVTAAQMDVYDQIRTYYEEQGTQPVRFYQEEDVQQIILIRHGEPMLDKHHARPRKAMKQYIYDYDTARVWPFAQSPVLFTPQDLDTIYASPIVRASDTAHKLFGNEFVIVEDSVFREFEREVFPLPLIHLRPKTWGIISRIPWMLGLQSRKIEGYGHAKRRAKSDARFLEQKAKDHGRAALVAHGFLNRYLKKNLLKNGWQLSYDGGKGYLSVQVLSKVVQK